MTEFGGLRKGGWQPSQGQTANAVTDGKIWWYGGIRPELVAVGQCHGP